MTTEGRLLGDRYRLSQPIGRGRGGFIWIAQDQRVHRTVAAKPVALPQGGTSSDAELEVAVQRARDAVRLKHQCAVTVYDVLIEGDGIWLITEYVPSRTMADFLAGHGKLSAQDTVTLGAQLAAALAAAAELGITHRAVEPANVLLADDGGVQITDFGVGALHHDPAFRAPEVIAGVPATPASDTFSLGATLYFAMHGVTPFGPLGTDKGPDFGGDVPDTTAPADAATLLPRLLGDMMATNPSHRPSMSACWEALAAIAEGRQPSPHPVPQQPTQQPTNGVDTTAAAPSVAQQVTPPAAAQPPAQPHPTTPIRTQPAPPPAPAPAPPMAAAPAHNAPGWHQQPMPPAGYNNGMTGMTGMNGYNGMNAAYPAQPGPAANAAQPGTPLSQNRTAIRVLLVVAVLAAAMVGILFTEFLLV